MVPLFKALQQKLDPIAQGLSASPAGQAAQGNWNQVMPALQQRLGFFAQHPENISFGGEMQGVNPGGFAGALNPAYNTGVDAMTARPMQGAALARPGFNQLKPQTPNQTNLGAMQTQTQSPDLTMYEQALNTKNIPIMERLASVHPGDARFLVHRSLQALMGGGK